MNLGKQRCRSERSSGLPGEAVIGRLGDVANKLPDEVIKATPESHGPAFAVALALNG